MQHTSNIATDYAIPTLGAIGGAALSFIKHAQAYILMHHITSAHITFPQAVEAIEYSAIGTIVGIVVNGLYRLLVKKNNKPHE